MSNQATKVSNGEGTLTMTEVTATTGKRRQSRISMAETIEFRFIAALSFAVCLIGFADAALAAARQKAKAICSVCVMRARQPTRLRAMHSMAD